jgi:hypothetical protein
MQINPEMFPGEGDPRNITSSGGLSSTRNEGLNKGLSRLLGNPAEASPGEYNFESAGRQRNPNMRLGDFPSSGRSRL